MEDPVDMVTVYSLETTPRKDRVSQSHNTDSECRCLGLSNVTGLQQSSKATGERKRLIQVR